jgi:serine/threonine protein phosphatase PrpC
VSLRISEHAERSDTGRQRRANEDAYLARPPLFAVADGMGGAQAGEVASRIAVESFDDRLPAVGTPEQRLTAAARAANEAIHRLSVADRERAGMGTTLTAVHVGADEVVVAHVGDSRAYRLRDGRLEPLTRDHSLVQALIDEGRLSAQEAANHPQRSIITRALGPEPDVEVEIHTYPARPGDVFLLCSDGLTSMLDEETIERVLLQSGRLAEAGDRLVAAANAAGGRDNITVVLFRLEEDGAADGQAPVVERAVGVGPPTAVAAGRDSVPARRHPAPAAVRPSARRRRRALKALAIALAILVPILAGGWVASRAVYFLGTNDEGVVTVFRGLPYELPAGLKLYETWYVSGVPARDVPPRRRASLLDHRLRSERDASDLVDQLELGRLSP